MFSYVGIGSIFGVFIVGSVLLRRIGLGFVSTSSITDADDGRTRCMFLLLLQPILKVLLN